MTDLIPLFVVVWNVGRFLAWAHWIYETLLGVAVFYLIFIKKGGRR